MSKKMLSWRGPKGAEIPVSFDADLFGSQEMQTQIELMSRAHPNLPDEVPRGSGFAFAGERGTGHLLARFRVGDTVYRSAHRDSLKRLWESVHFIDDMLHAGCREEAAR